MAKKISISGPASSGKSTLVNDLYPTLPDVERDSGIKVSVYKENSRQLWSEDYQDKYPTYDDLLADRKTWSKFQNQLVDLTVTQLNTNYEEFDIVIFDGGALENIVYTLLHDNSQSKYFSDSIIRSFKAMCDTDFIFKTTCLGFIEDDNFRTLDLGVRQAEIALYDRIQPACGFHILPLGRVDRINDVLKFLPKIVMVR